MFNPGPFSVAMLVYWRVFPIENWYSSKVPLDFGCHEKIHKDESVDVRLATVNSSGKAQCQLLVVAAGVAGGAIIGFIQQTLEFHHKFQHCIQL